MRYNHSVDSQPPASPAGPVPPADLPQEVFPVGHGAPQEVAPEPTLDDVAQGLRPDLVEPDAWNAEARAALNRLRAKPAAKRYPDAVILVVTLALFALTMGSMGWLEIAVLIGILLVHELGHLAAMRWFGYHDTKVFFIPFFGAAAAGRKDDASQVQRALVALAGPVPGIALVAGYLIVVLLGQVARPSGAVLTFAGFALALNGLNLLPFVPLDGGRFLTAILFSRHPWLETGCKALAVLVFGAAGYFSGQWLFWVIAAFLVLSLSFTHRAAVLSQSLRREHLNRPPGLADLPDAELLRAYVLARSAYPDAKGIATPTKLVELRIGLLQRAFPNALSEPAPIGAAAALLALYVVAFCAGGLGMGYIVYSRSADAKPAQLAEAEEHYAAGDLVAAIVTAKQELDRDPENAAMHAALSIYLYKAGSPDEAAVHARRAMLLQPRDPKPYFVLGSIACDGGDADAASAQLRTMRANVRSRAGKQYETELERRIGAIGLKPPGSERAAPPAR